MHSIRFKITAITIVEILTAILCVFLASLLIIRAESDRNTVRTMNLLAEDTAKSIEKYTESIEESVKVAANVAIDSLDSVELVQSGIVSTGETTPERTKSQVERGDAYIADYTKRILPDCSTVANHTRGVITYYYCISPNVSTKEHGFFYSRVGKTGFAEREPLDARELDPNDMAHTTWYYTPIERGRPSWVGPYTAHFLNEMLISSYLVPVYKSGTLIGVLGMDIPFETFASLVSSISVYDSGFACLLDSLGNVLYHPGLASGSMPELPVDKSVLAHNDSGDALIRYKVAGEERQMCFTTLSNGMKLVIAAPTAEVNASSRHLTQIIFPLSIAVVLLFAILSLFLIRRITLPLLNLTAASQRLAMADYSVPLSYDGKDEVGALTSAFRLMRDQLQTYIDDLNHRILTDDLTQLPNQRHFFDLALASRDQLLEEGKSPVMLYFNLMGMKHFNRQYGFDEGDRLICEVARVLERHFGTQRTSRFGQDHFAAVTDEDRLEEQLYEVLIDCQIANEGRTVPISIGIYQYSLEKVDVSLACDRAKYACDHRRGSYYSGYCYFDNDMLRQADLFRYVVNHLDQALDEQWVQVYYQPIVRAVNGRVCDEEALSRWFDPEHGRLAPGDFIQPLEDSGLIYKLDLYVLDRVLEKIKHQREAGLTIVPHSVNLSRSDFDALDMVEEICKRVDAAGVDRSLITVEITESIIGSNFDYMKQQVERFRALGFPVWMDDFGSGYSSLDFLQSIRCDLIKFDMSFLRKIDEGESGKIILTELMQMATALGIDTVCEGVESQSHVRFLREIGCSKLQGYYYCPPIPFEEIVDRYHRGAQIGYINPRESEYYEAIGRVNLHDLTSIAQEDEGELRNIFDSLPMGILEIGGNKAEFVRTNQSLRDFIARYFVDNPVEPFFLKHVAKLTDDSNRIIFDEHMPNGTAIHVMARCIRVNPVTNATAIAIAVLSIG